MILGAQTPFATSTSTAVTALGSRHVDGNGRTFHYAEAGASTLGRGKLAVEATVEANHINLSWQTAPAVGDRQVKVTLGATAAAKDLYKNGWLVNQDGGGEGRAYAIEGHPAADSAGTITIDLKEAIDTVGVASETNVDLIKNRYKDLVITVADQADPVAGVPLVSITADYYGYVQTWGPCAVWFDEAVTAGKAITTGTGTVGQVEMLDAAGEAEIAHAGPNAGVDTEYQLVYLRLNP